MKPSFRVKGISGRRVYVALGLLEDLKLHCLPFFQLRRSRCLSSLELRPSTGLSVASPLNTITLNFTTIPWKFILWKWECFFRKNLIPIFSKSTYYWHTKAMACSWKIRSIAIGGWLIVPITASKSCHQIFWIPNRRFFGRLALIFPLVTRLLEVYYPTMLRQGEIYEKYYLR